MPLSVAVERVTTDVRDLASAWSAFWTRPEHPGRLAAVRVVCGLMCIYSHSVWGMRLDQFFAGDGFQPLDVVASYSREAVALSYWFWVPPEWAWPVHLAGLAVVACFTVGLWTMITAPLAAAVVISTAQRVPTANFGLDQVLGFLTLYLALAPCGRAFSIDWLIRRYREAKSELKWGRRPKLPATASHWRVRLATRLIQVQLCVVYTYAGIAKLKGEAWWDGSAVWRAVANLEYQSFDMTWLAWHPWASQMMTHATVAWEISFWALVWVPRLRPYVLAVGVLMHVGIGAVLGMWTFGLAMVIAYEVFTPMPTVRAAGRWLSARAVGPPRRVELPTTPKEIRRAAFLLALDVNGRIAVGGEPAAAPVEPRPELPTWRTAVAAGPEPDWSGTRKLHVLFVDSTSRGQSQSLKSLTKRGFAVTVAGNWGAACLIRHAVPVNVVVLNAATLTAGEVDAVHTQMADDPDTPVVLISHPKGSSAWTLRGCETVTPPATLREVRRAIERAVLTRTDRAAAQKQIELVGDQ